MTDTTLEQEYSDKNNQTSTVQKGKDKHFIEDDHFQKLISVLDDIYNTTQVRPSLRKLVNLIIKKADINTIREQLIKQYS